jgi:serine phosphatase RsbU (regulator of sigma subunit)
MCKKIADDNPDVFWSGITDVDNVFIAHTDINQVVASNQLPILFSSKFEELFHPNEDFEMRSDTIYITIPIFERNVLVGRLAVASSVRQINEARQTTIMTVGTVTLLMILIGIPLTMILLHRKLQPISVITDRLKNIDFSDISLKIPLKLRNEFGYLAETLRVMGQKLNVAQKEIVEKERIARELEIAREIQANILPKSFPQGSGYSFAGTYSSAREVGGDYYDFIRYDDRFLD